MNNQINHPTISASAEVTGYARPRTRGELADKLKSGVPCEVAGCAVSFTIIALRDWLGFDRFSVRPSENKGWCVFEA